MTKDFKVVIELIRNLIKTDLNDKQVEIIIAFLVDRFIDSTNTISAIYREEIVKIITDRIKKSDSSNLVIELDDYLNKLLYKFN